MLRKFLVLLMAALSAAPAGCSLHRASASVQGQDDAALEVHIDGLVRAGCYWCLKEALEMLPPTPRLATRRFELLMLAATRVRELGLRAEPDWLAQGQALAGPWPTQAQQVMIDLADATIMPRGTRAPMPSGGAVERINREQLGERARHLLQEPARTDVVAAFFLQHAACSDMGSGVDAVQVPDRLARVPLVAYRIASCGRGDQAALEAVVLEEPRLDEAHYFGAAAAFNVGALLTAERELDLFDRRFPAAPASALLRGQIMLALEEYEAAAVALDAVLAGDADQPDALLFKARAVSLLGDATRGEAAADRLVRLGTWFQGEAYFWRAWNRRILRRLDEAAEDIETAKRVLFNALVPKLAGFIAFEREQLDLALAELTTSVDRNGADCEVRFAIGQVHARRARWAEAASSFAATVECAQTAQAAARARLDEIMQAALELPRRARLLARAERDRATEHAREGLATFHAASAHVLAGRSDQARPFAERALGWDQWADRARALLEGLPARRN